MDTTFLYHRLPCSLQGPLYIIPPRPARACVTHPPSLPVLVSHPLLHFLPWHLTATLFLQHHLSRTALRVFFSSKLFPGSKCRILANLKAKNQAKDKKKWFFLSGCPLFKGSTWHPLLMRCQRTLSSHLLDIISLPEPVTPQVSFTRGLPHQIPTCCLRATERHRFRKNKLGSCRIGGKQQGGLWDWRQLVWIPASMLQMFPMMREKKEKKKKKDKYSACQIHSQCKSAQLCCHLAGFTHKSPSPSMGKVLQRTDPQDTYPKWQTEKIQVT